MLLLDTHVVSELRKVGSNRVNPQVENWAHSTPDEQTFISVITIFELERVLPLMERRDSTPGSIILRRWLNDHVLSSYAGRIIPMNVGIAKRCALLHVPDPMSDYDAIIAATALEHGLTVVTRNIGDFETAGVKLLNPFG